MEDGSPSFMLLDKALNGLRGASLCWSQLLSSTVEKVGLWSHSVEPCVYGGEAYAGNVFLGHVWQLYMLMTSCWRHRHQKPNSM